MPPTASIVPAVLAGALVAIVGARLLAAARQRDPLHQRGLARDPDRSRRPNGIAASVRDALGRARSSLEPHARRGPSADAVAEWCDDLGRRVRAGSTLRDALVTTTPHTPTLAGLVAPIQLRLERGTTVARALAIDDGGGRGRRIGSDSHFDLARHVIATTALLGGPSAPALDRVAAALRLRSADQQERAAHSAQARMSAHVLTLVPLGFLAVVLAIDGSVRTVVTTPTGAAIVAAGVAFNCVGWLWMRTVIGRAP